MSDSYIALVEKSIDERTQQYQELLQLREENKRLREENENIQAANRYGKDWVDQASQDITRLRTENEKLREALKPFADDELHEGLGDGPDDERTHWPSFLLGDLRRARAILKGDN